MSISGDVYKGDLVRFYSSYLKFMKDYVSRNPGVVLDVTYNISHPNGSIKVLWSSGEITHEHASYIRLISRRES